MQTLDRLADHGFRKVEYLLEKSGKYAVRVYTDEKGWSYLKVNPEDIQSIDAFAAKVKGPAASRKVERI